MKKILLSILCALPLSAFAQDVIICRNGDEITSKILKISKSEVEYKKWTNPDGPTYTLEKADIFMIKYQNGEKDVFKDEPSAPSTAEREQSSSSDSQTESSQTPSEPIPAKAAADNAELIAQYNNDGHEYIRKNPEKKSTKNANAVIGTLGVTSSSILSTEDIEISLEHMGDCWNASGLSVGDEYDTYWTKRGTRYAIMIKNKTSRVIYIDKAACFGTSSKGVKRYFDPQEYSVTEGGDSGGGASVNLGSVADAFGVGGVVGTLASGVNVGGDKGKFTATTKTYKDERLLIVPPHASVALSVDNSRDHPTKKRTHIVTGSYEYFGLESITNSLSLKRNQTIVFTEENSPWKMNYMITYSLDNGLNKCVVVNFGVYMKDICGFRPITTFFDLKKHIKATPKTIWGCYY